MVNKVSLNIFEIINNVKNSKSKKDKIATLQQYKCPALTDVLRCFFDDIVNFSLPPGIPPYEPAKEESVPSNLHKQIF